MKLEELNDMVKNDLKIDDSELARESLNKPLLLKLWLYGTTVILTSEAFTIDRSKWNVKYGSKSFFDNLGDKFINDDIELQLTVKVLQT